MFLSSSLRGRPLATGWELPSDLTQEEWLDAGRLLGKVERSVSWWLGDWWRAFKPTWGEQEKVFGNDWDGPSYHTCRVAGAVCAAFESDRRRSDLGFAHHAEVVSLPREQADTLLDWAGSSVAEIGRPRSVRELRTEVHRRRNSIGSEPSGETCVVEDLNTLIERGEKFGCIYADPPWLYNNQGTRAATGNHYKGMTVDELCALPVPDLAAPDAHLHLWTTNGFLFEAPRIFDAWGFEFRSSFVWVKSQIGIGNYWRNSHEFLLTAIRGDAKSFADHSLTSWFESSWFECDRGAHSAKPEQVRAMIEKASPGPRLELFGRRKVDGWKVWGNQVERDLFLAQEAIA